MGTRPNLELFYRLWKAIARCRYASSKSKYNCAERLISAQPVMQSQFNIKNNPYSLTFLIFVNTLGHLIMPLDFFIYPVKICQPHIQRSFFRSDIKSNGVVKGGIIESLMSPQANEFSVLDEKGFNIFLTLMQRKIFAIMPSAALAGNSWWRPKCSCWCPHQRD